VHIVKFAVSEITLLMMMMMMMMTVTECGTLTFANCNNCTDVDPATAKAECNSCDPGYALKDDNSTCTSMFYELTIIFFVYSFLVPDVVNKVVP